MLCTIAQVVPKLTRQIFKALAFKTGMRIEDVDANFNVTAPATIDKNGFTYQKKL